MARASATTFKGLLPLLDRKRVPEPYVVDGKNFYVSADGPVSGFAKRVVANEAIEDPDHVQSFRVNAGQTILVFVTDAVLQYSDEGCCFYPVFTFTDATEPFPWSHATVGGINYFAKKGVGLFQFNETTGQWALISGGSVPADIQACTQSGGRLVVAATGISAWTTIDDGTDFVPSTVTGAGAQSLSLVAAGGPDDILGLVEVSDGYLTLTKNGIMRSELINAINPFRHRRMTEQHDPLPINPFCIIEMAEFQHVILSRQGFFSLVAGKMEPWQPLMGEYFHSTLLPQFDLEALPSVVRLSVNLERQWFMASIAANESPAIYTDAYMLYMPSDEWGILNQVHAGFIDVDVNTGSNAGFSFGMVDSSGTVTRFTDGPADELWPDIELFDYDYQLNIEYPSRREISTTMMPSRLHFAPIDEGQFTSSGVYNLAFVFEEQIEPVDQSAPDEFPAVVGPPAEMKTVMQMSEGIKHIITKAAPFEEASLDAYVDIGLWRFSTDENPDETSLITDVIVGMLDAGEGIGDEYEDWLLDYSQDIFFDWLTDTSGDEDWNAGGAATTNYTAIIYGTDDGYAVNGVDLTPQELMQEELTLIQQKGRNRFFSCNNNGLFHRIKFDASEIGESFALKTIDIRGIQSGRV